MNAMEGATHIVSSVIRIQEWFRSVGILYGHFFDLHIDLYACNHSGVKEFDAIHSKCDDCSIAYVQPPIRLICFKPFRSASSFSFCGVFPHTAMTACRHGEG